MKTTVLLFALAGILLAPAIGASPGIAATPTLCTISINDDTAYTSSTDVTLTLFAVGASHMRFQNENLGWSSWVAYSTTNSHQLSSGQGTKTVWVEFTDGAGHIADPVDDTIILDTTAPTGCSISINSGDAYTAYTTVNLTLAATGAAQMCFSNNNATWSEWVAYATSRAWELSSGDGPKTVYARFMDAAGNISTAVSDGITLDTAVPEYCSVSINSGAAYTKSLNVTLNLSAEGASEMRFSNNQSTWSSWVSYSTTAAWSLTEGEGTKWVYAQFRDAAGNMADWVQDSIILDTIPPANCSISINNGATHTNSTSVTLNLGANLATEMRFGNSSMKLSNWIPISATSNWTLAGADGVKTVYAQFRDIAGNVSSTVSDTITLDTTPPANGAISINGGAAYTTIISVTLTVSATGASQMSFSNDSYAWSAWQAYGAAKTWNLESGDGVRTVYVRFRDTAGNISASVSDDITRDSTPPTGSISINGGAEYSTSASVALAVSATEAVEMRFTNDNTFWPAWEAYGAAKAWTLSNGDGNKTVYAQFRDLAGNVETVADGIYLDTVAPTGTVVINGGAASTNNAIVTLTFSAPGAIQMRVRNDAWTDWLPYNTTGSWSLTSGEGLKTVYAQFRDAAGNVAEAQDSINLNTVSSDLTPILLLLQDDRQAPPESSP